MASPKSDIHGSGVFMASVSIPSLRSRRSGRWFYLFMAILLAALIFAGFARTYPASIAATPPLPPWLHAHAAVVAAWVLLVVAQPALIAGGAPRVHRALGWVGAILAVAMVIMGFVAVIVALRENYIPSFLPRRIFVVGNLLSVVCFGGLVATAVASRRRPEWHKRLMIMATILIISQALGRLLPMSSFGDAAPAVLFGVVTLLALIGPAFDLMVRGRVHPAYFLGLGVLLAFEISTPAIAFSPLAPWIIHELERDAFWRNRDSQIGGDLIHLSCWDGGQHG
jgi:hypothetical protein